MECVCRNFGGRWEETEHGPGVIFSDGNACFPLNKVGKQFANGGDDCSPEFLPDDPCTFWKSKPFWRRTEC
jgi:hypothetical protein